MDWITQALSVADADRPRSPGEVLLPDIAAGGVSVFSRVAPDGSHLPNTERSWLEPWPHIKPKQMELKEVATGFQNSLAWETNPAIGDPQVSDRLVVRLRKGEEVSLELSSIPRAHRFDDFAINASPLPPTSKDTAMRGRHPMVSPVRTVTLTHAVRRPLNRPGGTLMPQREQGQAFVVLEPNPEQLGIDPRSTAKLEVTAKWNERSNEGSREIANAPLQTIVVNRGDRILKDKIRHEFGDTKHRNVTYTVTAISRFRQFFDDQESNDAFVVSTVLPSVSIPNSGRPPSPVVLSTRPAFIWDEQRDAPAFTTLTRRRSGGLLRVELKQPWFETGEGEQLAVLVWTDAKPPKEIWPFLTQTGCDPIFRTGTSDRFPVAATFTQTAGPAREVFLPEAQGLTSGPGSIVAVPFSPWFHDDRWFADIGLPRVPRDAYGSFVQLVLARYQPDSLKTLELSPLVKTELIQLLPDRTMTVKRSANEVFVSLEGSEPFGIDDGGNKFTVVLERLQLPPGMPNTAVELVAMESPSDPNVPAWVPVPHGFTRGGLGRAGLRLQIPQGLGRTRIRIQEFEDIDEPNTGGVGVDTRDLLGRTVLTDVVDLPNT